MSTDTKTFDPCNPPHDLPSITTHLQTLVTLIIQHLNTRDLPESPLWSSLSPNFTTRGMGYEAPSAQAFIDDYHDYAFRFPDHCSKIKGIETQLNSRLTRGEVFMSLELTGGHGVQKGVLSRQCVVVCQVRKAEGRWVVDGAVSMPGGGLEGGGGGFGF
ncbi:hypothetical protein M409DRAFT_26388 [Zasmidium cellare ATCC 36951]|uniref:SnoaL-like domain-containing protein n=1 Tax=Zasmidium cellare ATCC 36951 TaxID=1080233 RepID=A0A6A6C8I6_ZASCE|nr:uncharacterized protein M409DRAFT_26388 [Zasmidium cellare ATCC 36951]KAF2163351.1 hypothetical protein M409DRAFT_26388 [Zasmidium cellare ATCC 36951]